MTPAARLAATAQILARWSNSDLPADRVLDAWGRAHRFAGSKDRAWIAERVFAIFRHRAELEALMGEPSPRALALGSLNLFDHADQAGQAPFFEGKFALEALNAEEAARLSAPAPMVDPWPAWLAKRLRADLGDAAALAEMALFHQRAPVDLRVNALKAERDEALAKLADQGIPAKILDRTRFGLRLERQVRLDHLDLARDGWLEPQDEGAQIATEMLDVRPGQRVLDLCAGAGGKSLALAALMDNQGTLIADDIDPRRLGRLVPRAARAGITILRCEKPQGSFDRIMVDAPCSGSGTWRRQPDAPWRLTPERLETYHHAQGQLLDRAADLVAPQGRIAYVTCSLLTSENEDQVAAFLKRRPDVVVTEQRRLLSAVDECDAFFIAILAPSALGEGP